MSKKRPARHGRARSLAVSAWPLRFKVALALAIPLLLAATLGGLRVRGDLTEAANSSSSAKQVTVLRPAVDYLTAAERAMVAGQDTSDASAADLDAALQDVQTAADELVRVSNNADLTADQRYQVDALLDLSRAIREADTDTLLPETWTAQLRQLQSGVTQLITTIVNAQINPEPRLELLAQTLAGRFSLAMQQALFATESSGPTGDLELFAELGVEGAAIDRLASSMGDSEPAVASLRTANADRSHTVRTSGDSLGGAEAYTDYDTLIGSLEDGIDNQLAAAADDARQRALVSGGITVLALLATLILAFLVSRLLLNPIRRVREGAYAVAHEQLPEEVARIRAGADPGQIVPIDVTTHEEIGQLARAVDDMHRQAVILASGEARLRSQVSEMFITLSRRNTSLINQQLGLIETLEKDEEDPRRLESLFRLDHLAARMRRTADSLLILADAPTRTSADDNLTVAAAMQAATAGVQDYQRVRVGAASTTRINEAAAADVVHLLTELVDNALAYSAPTTTVRLTATAAADGVTIDIEDTGLGIPDRILAAINDDLRHGAEVTPDTARRMGLFVVSRLALRHGITASLRRNRHDGTTATVVIPASILAAGQAEGPTAPPVDHWTREQAPARTAPTPAPAPQPSPAEPLSLEARLEAAMRLPQRQPGSHPRPGAPTPAAADAEQPSQVTPPSRVPPPPQVTPSRVPPPPLMPLVARVPPPPPMPEITNEPPAPVVEERPTPTPEVEDAPALSAPAASAPTAPPTATAYATAAATAAEPVNGTGRTAFPPMADSEAEADTPIFKALRSAWLSANAADDSWRSSEIEAGWDRADSVAAPATPAPLTGSGLPIRRPGTRLVPGGVTKSASTTSRDPEAIRARLAAHAAGVSRGREAAATTSDQQSPEAGNS